jgi:hypothetical protein
LGGSISTPPQTQRPTFLYRRLPRLTSPRFAVCSIEIGIDWNPLLILLLRDNV